MDAFEIHEFINEAEVDLKMDSSKTIISTIVSFKKPNHEKTMLSERLLMAS